MTPAHNTNALLLGTGEFNFSDGATTAVEAKLAGFRDFGNMTTFTLAPESTKVEHKGSYRGTKRTDRTRITEAKLVYQLKLDEWTLQNLLYIFYGDENEDADFTQEAIASTSADAIAASSDSPLLAGNWYDIEKSSVRVRHLTSVTVTSKVEGTDFIVDYNLGRIRFLANQTSSVTPTIVAPAIAVGSEKAMKAITPLTSAKRSGIGRLYVFDDDADNQIIMQHEDFGCDISLTGNVDGGSDNFTEFTLEVLVTDPVGTVLSREKASGY
jgi:hypothetical protein